MSLQGQGYHSYIHVACLFVLPGTVTVDIGLIVHMYLHV